MSTDVDVAVDVIVIVIGGVIVAVHLNGNDTVMVILPVGAGGHEPASGRC